MVETEPFALLFVLCRLAIEEGDIGAAQILEFRSL